MILQPNCKGTYALILYLSSRCSLRVGRLGIHEFNRGYYLYVGSAFGFGGLAARIRHHVQPSDRPHWHIDYLRSVSRLKGVWVICSDFGSDVRLEHPWAGVIERMPDARVPVKGFGSTDCRCPTHLFYFMRRPRVNLFQEALSENGIAAQIRQLKDFSLIYKEPVSSTGFEDNPLCGVCETRTKGSVTPNRASSLKNT